MVGIPGSGKSTFVGILAKTLPHTTVVCPDEYRDKLHIQATDWKGQKHVFDLSEKAVKDALASGQNVIFDATNTRRKIRRKFASFGKTIGAQVVYCVMGTTLDEAIERNATRPRKVPKDVIERMAGQLSKEPVNDKDINL